MIKKLITLLFFIAAIPIIVLAFRNAQVVEVDYVFGVFSAHLSWLVVGAFALGVLVMLPFFAVAGQLWKGRAKGLKKQLDTLDKQRQKDDIANAFNQQSAVD